VNKKSGVELLAVLHAAHAAENAVEAKLNEVGLSFPKLMALQVLADAGDPMPLTQLAERLSCVKSNITKLVDRLEADGLVARQGDPKDRRARLAALTPAGRKAVVAGADVRQDAERAVLQGLSVAEARQLAQLMDKLGKHLG
jgi:DNA-binding MarR family transcriptional regulator